MHCKQNNITKHVRVCNHWDEKGAFLQIPFYTTLIFWAFCAFITSMLLCEHVQSDVLDSKQVIFRSPVITD